MEITDTEGEIRYEETDEWKGVKQHYEISQ